LGAGCFAVEFALLRRNVPPDHVKTFDDFVAWRPDARLFYVTDTKPPQLIALGRLEGLAPTGPGGYVFDEQGRLTEWQVESGDGGPVTKLLDGVKKSVTRAEAKAWLAERRR
jgi:hypothetical protein